MTVDAVRAELAAVAREHERAADEWRTRALAAEAQRDLLGEILGELDAALCRDTYALSDIPDDVRSVVAERDLLARIIWSVGGTVEHVHGDTHDWMFPSDALLLNAAEADAVRRIIGEGER